MVDVKISELPVAGSAATTDQLEANQSGTSRSITVAQIGTSLGVVTGGPYLPLTGGTLAGPGNLAVSGTLGVTGATTLSAALTGTTALFAAGASTPAFRATGNDAVLLGLFNGATKGVRFTTDASQVKIEGVDNTGVGSFQPLTLGGSIVQVGAPLSGTTATFSGTVSAPGAQVQMVSVETGAVATGTTLIPVDDTIPQITEGTEFMTLAITPKSATSKLIIEVVAHFAHSVTGGHAAALFQDATANALAASLQQIIGASSAQFYSFRHVMTSGTTSATTFRFRMGGQNAGTTTFNGITGSRFFGGTMASSIVIREVT